MRQVIDIADKIMKLPIPLNWLVVITILFYGNKYFEKYMDENYYNGLKFWLNEKNHPWLLGEIRRGNIAIPLQILLQGASAIGLRAYPVYYYLALASATVLGGWFPAPMIAALTIWHSLCSLYPETYHLYMKDQLIISAFIKEKIKPFIATMKQLNPEITEAELEVETHKEFKKIRKTYETSILREHGPCYALKEPMTTLSIACRSAIGGFLGWQTAAFATTGIGLPIVGMITGASILGGMLYSAESHRIMDKHIRERMEAETIAPDEKAEARTCREITSDTFASILNISNGITGAMSTIGTGARLLRTSSTLPIVMIAAIESSINITKFNSEKVKRTTRTLLAPPQTKVSKIRDTLFHRPTPAALAASTLAMPRPTAS